MIKNITLNTLCVASMLWSVVSGAAGIDNSKLIPIIVDNSLVKPETTNDGTATSPDWVKSLIIAEVYVGSASPDGKFAGMPPVLDHLAEMGVNGIWLTPINEGYQYGNHGIHTLNSGLTGEKDPAQRWKVVKNFVDEAHKRNIRIFFDVVTWGVDKRAPMLKERPDWFTGEIPRYRGWLWDWDNAELNEWFASRLVDLVSMTGADGIRADCAPFYAMYKPYRMAKERLRQMGRNVIFISEHASARYDVFDFDQVAFVKSDDKPRGDGDIYLEKNIVDAIKSGDELIARDMDRPGGEMRFYSFLLSSHDSKRYMTKGSPVTFGYQMLFSPFIPIWYIGEEWNNPYSRVKPPMWLFANEINWNSKELPANRAFFETVKKMIRIRRQYPDIFEYFPDNHRESNIAKVVTDRTDLLQPYVRFRYGRGIIIVPNNSKESAKINVTVPWKDIQYPANSVALVKDLMTNREIANSGPQDLKHFEVELAPDTVGVYLVEWSR